MLSKTKDLGLFTPYKNDRRRNQIIQKFITIGFLPMFYGREKFHELLQKTSERCQADHSENKKCMWRLQQLAEYNSRWSNSPKFLGAC